MDIKKEDLVTLYDCVFTKTHTDGFKLAEMKDLLADDNYWFIEKPRDNWKNGLNDKLKELGYKQCAKY